MATTLYFLSSLATISRGQNDNGQSGNARWWRANSLGTSAGSVRSILSVTSTAGPVTAIDGSSSGVYYEFISPPLAAAETISGTISFNLWGREANMSANAAIGCRVDKVSAVDLSLTNIFAGKDNAEMSVLTGDEFGLLAWTGTPTSTAMAKGDRLRAQIYFDDAGTNMGSGYILNAAYGYDVTNYADSWFSLTETLTFQTTDPTTQQVFPINTASDLATADVDYKAWTSRGT